MPGPSITVPDGMSLDEARRFGAKFSQRIGTHPQVAVWWRPEKRELVIRSVPMTTRPLPDGLVEVGRYKHPYPARLFLQDLGAAMQVTA